MMGQQDLHALLGILALPDAPCNGRWGRWRFARIEGGENNVLYRATDDQADLAVKFTARDARDRAGREYATLAALQHMDAPIAPAPILLERERFAHLVVVQTWLDGWVTIHPPDTDSDWRQLLDHYAAIHRITPARTDLRLPPAVLTMTSAAAGRWRIWEQVRLIPDHARPPTLMDLVGRTEQAAFPDWPTPPLALCRCDPNTRNFIRRPVQWASVDWENSGWGDPAFEIADLMAHPTYAAVPGERWDWLIGTYDATRADRTVAERIRTYYTLSLVWWVARFARMLYEIPRGLERQRLITRPATWQSDTEAKYARYLDAARTSLP